MIHSMAVPPTFSHASTARLTPHDLGRFPGATLFDRIARAVCEAGCLPRKELYEAWEVARRTRRLFRGGRVVDVVGEESSSSRRMCASRPCPPATSTTRRARRPFRGGRVVDVAGGAGLRAHMPPLLAASPPPA